MTPPTFNIVVSGFNGTAQPVTRKVTATLRPGADPARVAKAAATVVTCHLNGNYPSVTKMPDFQGQAYFSATTWCDDYAPVRLYVAIQQAVPGGGYSTEGMDGPARGTIVGLGISTKSKPCFEISLGAWRGLADPWVETPDFLIDFGWYWTSPDTPLSC